MFAALIGAVTLVALRLAGASRRVGAAVGGGVSFVLRMLADTLHWHLPVFG